MNFSKKWLYVVVLSAILVPLIIIFVLSVTDPTKKKEEPKVNDASYTTADGRVTVTAKLYLPKNDKQIIGFFTYSLNEYEENSSKEILDKQISYFLSTRKDLKLFKKEKVIDMDDKTITKVEYTGTNTDSSECVYVFAVIDFKADTNYVLYSNEVLLHKDYEKNISEMIDILKNVKLNQS
ncbi:MAG: hypothetical protein BHW07_03735 [Clostridium sp. CAG_433_25_7]|nr:MAG: hypothetical protein BHW07_03735 [Clostridium sp. CAG_433_25_7]